MVTKEKIREKKLKETVRIHNYGQYGRSKRDQWEDPSCVITEYGTIPCYPRCHIIYIDSLTVESCDPSELRVCSVNGFSSCVLLKGVIFLNHASCYFHSQQPPVVVVSHGISVAAAAPKWGYTYVSYGAASEPPPVATTHVGARNPLTQT